MRVERGRRDGEEEGWGREVGWGREDGWGGKEEEESREVKVEGKGDGKEKRAVTGEGSGGTYRTRIE